MILEFKKENIINFKTINKLENLIKLVTKTLTYKEYQKTDFYKMVLPGEGNSDWHKFFNYTTDPITWLSIYKYDKLYGSNWSSNSKSMNLISKGNILDFGAGSGMPWVHIPDEVTLYLLEINLVLFNKLVENYASYKNVKVINSLNEIKTLKFDFIYSKDVLEHVRYVNEHLEILYHLGNDSCQYYLDIDSSPAGTHVLNLHDDTIINDFWMKLIK
jgi:2-polyprenyl-3-methyl-5-hydroxy-6-metoxy-1,4-benzoquinol methylase